MKIASLLLLPLLLGPASAWSLCLLCSCTASTTPVIFGAYNPIGGSPATGTGDVTISCSGTVGLFVNYSISLGKGSYGSTYSDRQMASGSGRLSYQLYGESPSGAPCAVVWGDGSGNTSVVGGSLLIVLLGSNIRRQVCGSLPANQRSATPGSYSDTLQVVVTYN